MTRFCPRFLSLSALAALTACQTTKPYLPAQPAKVRSVTVETRDFYGRQDVYADIQGTLSSNAAQLADIEQIRSKDNTLILKVTERTPRGLEGTNKTPNPPFQTRVPLEILGLEPGQQYTVNANGTKTSFIMPLPTTDQATESP